ncbi:Hypothetical protein PBC10988_22930 [Planctomycetales bacterium 10988]|nr:Hypothetical protein PBC10988_22930 [Planctomycetales bacterium 10988]
MAGLIFLVNLLTTTLMTGVIWIVQIVHYPLFSSVGESFFPAYALQHQSKISPVVAPLMILELGTAVLMLLYPPKEISIGWVWFGLALVGVIWISTFTLQVPIHGRLGERFDSSDHITLVLTNWIRTIAWTIRTGLLLWIAWESGLKKM